MLRTNREFLDYIEQLYINETKSGFINLQGVRTGDKILTQGEFSKYVYVIKEGIAKCFFSEENGKDYILEFLGTGEILGELEAIKKTLCLCSVSAVTSLKFYTIPLDYFNDLLSSDMSLSRLLLEEMAERMINTSSRASFQQLYTIEHGLAKLLDLQQKQQLVISKEDMAAYLGITLRSLNRALKAF
jgi:CRP-like cAMP-binding protein